MVSIPYPRTKSPLAVDGAPVGAFGLVCDRVSVVSLCTFDGIFWWAVAAKCGLECLREGVDGRVWEAAEKLAEWFGLSDREVNWVRMAKAGNEEDGYSEALLGVDGDGSFPLRVRASEYEAAMVDGKN
jgi:hypothetical protein